MEPIFKSKKGTFIFADTTKFRMLGNESKTDILLLLDKDMQSKDVMVRTSAMMVKDILLHNEQEEFKLLPQDIMYLCKNPYAQVIKRFDPIAGITHVVLRKKES